MEVVKRHWLAGNVEDTRKAIRKILSQQDDSTEDMDALLMFAYIFYQLGNIERAAQLLGRVKFDVFDVKQWTVENSMLVLKYLKSKNLEDQKAITLSFGLLHEKIGGLPYADVCRFELKVCLNYALVMFCSTAQQNLVPGGYIVSQASLLKTLCRACASPSYRSCQGVSQSIDDKLRFYFKNGQKQKQEELTLVATLVFLLASNYLVNSQVSEAKRLMDIVLDLYKPNIVSAKSMDFTFTLIVDSSKFQDILMPTCHLLCSFSLFVLKKKTSSLKYCDRCLSLKSEFISGLFMKGLLIYESGKHEDAIQCFQQIVALSNDNGYKSTALNFLGCICAKLGKPHTALLKFRESFACYSGRLEALYNIAVVYHDIGEFDLEISLWKYILKILSLRSWHVPDSCVNVNVDYICGIAAQCLSDSISEDKFLLSTGSYCAQRCNFNNPKLSLPSVLFKIAHNCLILERYSEACKFFGQLFAQLNSKPVDLQECGIAGILTLHKEFAEALFNCDRWDDCLLVCERILKQETVSNTLSKTWLSQDKAKLDTGQNLIDIMFCKAVVLKELQRPIEANECYESILDAINCNYGERSGDRINQLDEPQQKKQKREKCPTERRPEDYMEINKLKALTLNKQSLLLSSLGRKKEALLLLTQSISCEPDCLKYRYNHTKLLFDMGMDDVARKDWLEFRKIDQTASSSDSFKLKDLPEDDEDRDLYIEMDSCALCRLSKKF